MQIHSVEIKINDFSSDAMQSNRDAEVVKILRELADRLEDGDGIVSKFQGLRLRDSNGNQVGEIFVDWDNEDN